MGGDPGPDAGGVPRPRDPDRARAPLEPAPECPAKATIGADQEVCVDYVSSNRDAAADTLLTLGQFFTEWGVRLDDECVGEFCESETDIAVYIGGDEYEGDPADIELDDQLVIAIVIGTPPDQIPATADFSQA